MQKLPLVAILGVSLLSLASMAADPAPKNEAFEKHSREIAAAVPVSWDVRVAGDIIWIERKETAEMIFAGPNGPADPAKEFKRPSLMLRYVPAPSETDVAALNKRNSDRAKALAMLAAQMKDLTSNAMPTGDQGGYRASNADQQARLDAYVAVSKALPYQEPPTLFAGDAAFHWEEYWYAPAQEAVKQETLQVKARIEAIFATKPVK